MSALGIVLLAYVACMLVFILNLVDQIRENPEKDPIVDMARNVWSARVALTVSAVALSGIWPWFAFKACLRWIGHRAAGLSERLHAEIERLEAEEQKMADGKEVR